MQRNYELSVVLDYEITDEELAPKIEKIREIIKKEGGEVKDINKWGKRRLAYEIKKSKKGFYVLFHFTCLPEAIKAIGQDLKFVEGINRFMTVVISDIGTSAFSGADLEMTEEAI